jgi:hypothetical protein
MVCKNKNNIIAEYALKDINQPTNYWRKWKTKSEKWKAKN